jgi:hypothetical protein
MKWLGTYDSEKDYLVDDVVFYEGSSYICMFQCNGEKPGNRFYWSLMAKKGEDGNPGVDGASGKNGKDGVGTRGHSAYQLAVMFGFKGNMREWLKSLKGKDGKDGIGIPGKSAYELAISDGFNGTLREWLKTLKAKDGKDGVDGKSAYDIAVERGFSGTEDEWLDSLKGESSYQLAKKNGFSGSEEEYASLFKGATLFSWSNVRGLPSGGTANQVLKKRSDNSYDVEWSTVSSGATQPYVPTSLAGTFSVPENTQVLFTMPIDLGDTGYLDVVGYFLEVA